MDTIGILETNAIDAAIANNWEKAKELNQQIIEQDDQNLGAYLRLGFALLQSNEIPAAAKAYKSALRIQPKNHIAMENMERIEILQKTSKSSAASKEKKNLDPTLFLDVPGKTKTIQLVNLGQKHHLAELSIGQEVELKVKKRRIEVRTIAGNYIGTLPDDISKRIIFFLDENSVYKTYVKEASLSRILVFVKEITKGTKVRNHISFPQSTQPMAPVSTSNADGEESNEDDESKEGHDDDWAEGDSDNDHEEDEEKQDLIHIHTSEDEDDSEE